AAACAEMQRRLPKLALSEAAACLAHCTFKREFRPQASALVRAVVQHWNERQDLHDLKVVEVVDALVCIASWDLRPLPVLGAAQIFGACLGNGDSACARPSLFVLWPCMANRAG
ncbi:unnamed protein product, partial [Effrenium voratum]